MFLRVFLVGIFTLASSLVPAYAFRWEIKRSSGNVLIQRDTPEWRKHGRKGLVFAGDRLKTGKNGRIVLTNGEETIVVAPNSYIDIPRSNNRSKNKVIHQLFGQATFDIDRTKHRKFTVETPYLATTVKGTKFSVSVKSGTSSVSVDRGAVSVSDYDTGESTELRSQQTASTVHDSNYGLVTKGPGRDPSVVQGRRTRSSVSKIANKTVQKELGVNFTPTQKERKSFTTTRTVNNKESGRSNSNNGNGNNGNGNGNGGGNGNGNNGNGNGNN